MHGYGGAGGQDSRSESLSRGGLDVRFAYLVVARSYFQVYWEDFPTSTSS